VGDRDRPQERGLGRTSVGQRRKWIVLSNGILKIDDRLEGHQGALIDHSSQWWSPNRLGYRFDPTAGMEACPQLRPFLRYNLENDNERIALLQEWAGYCLLPTTDLQKFLLLEGEGSNGKSVYCALWRHS